MRRLVVASHAPNGQGEGVPPPRNAGEADAGGGILAPPSAPQAVGITTCCVWYWVRRQCRMQCVGIVRNFRHYLTIFASRHGYSLYR
jgi:hypothetical protein